MKQWRLFSIFEWVTIKYHRWDSNFVVILAAPNGLSLKYQSSPKSYPFPDTDSGQNEINILAINLFLPLILGRGTNTLNQSSKTVKLLTGTGLDQYEMNAVASTLYFILHNSVMFQISDIVLNKELVDLGLPKCISAEN